MQKEKSKNSPRQFVLAQCVLVRLVLIGLIGGMSVLHTGSALSATAGLASMGVPLPPRKPFVERVAFMLPLRSWDKPELATSLDNAFTKETTRNNNNDLTEQNATDGETPVNVATTAATVTESFISFIGFALNAGRASLQSPVGAVSDDNARFDAMVGDHEVTQLGRPVYQRVWKDVRDLTSRTRPTAALKALANHAEARNLTSVEYDQIRSHIAQAYMTAGKLADARKLSEASFHRSGDNVPLAGWVSGLVAWREGKYAQAGKFFSRSARAAAELNKPAPWMASAAAFWAGRAYLEDGNTAQGRKWLRESAQYNQTFYGMMALRALNKNPEKEIMVSGANHIHVNPVLLARFMRSDDAQTAIKSARNGKPGQAMNQLAKQGWLNAHDQREVVMHYALKKNIPSLALHIAKRYPRNEQGNLYISALYPELPWKPEQGFVVDKALVHALVRQESDFNPMARNATGATGLMQLMPSTARYMVKASGGVHDDLTDPKHNLSLGQSYIRYLLNDQAVDNNLFFMAVAYNAGPGNLARWKKELGDIAETDPLLFIETIPVPETRAFVERVLRNYWMYSMRMGIDTPSLDAAAKGKAPLYAEEEFAFLVQ